MNQRIQPVIWCALAALTLGLFLTSKQLPNLTLFPDAWVLSPTNAMNSFMNGFVDIFGPAFKAIGALLEWPIKFAQFVLHLSPWSVTAVFCIALGYAASGTGLALFVGFSILYMAGIGYWDESMNSLSIVLISVPMAICVGFIFGVWGAYSKRAKRIIMPILDLLQTIPAFAYLLPILILFGFGTTVGLVASILYAFPPMVRNTILGLRSVPSEIVEAGLISGATPSQLFWKVRIPAAQNQMLLGVNQTTMASLSMVIIASIIGGTSDIGWEVLSAIRKAQFGESLLVGFVIALIAMALDRITYGFAKKDRSQQTRNERIKFWGITFGLMLIFACLSFFVPFLKEWPKSIVFDPASSMNDALEYIVINGRENIEALKNTAFFFVMLPLKIGLNKAVSPFTWGFALTPTLIAFYALLVGAVAIWAFQKGRQHLASLIVLAGVLLFVGLTNVAWVALILIIVFSTYVTSGVKLAIGTTLSLLFLVLAGIWPQTVLSLYLCGLGVFICFILGTAIGIWASESDLVSKIIRPIIDTLQTMPLFVILIPFVMVFKIGEFTALLAIIAYAIVPAIRYTEHGLRNLPNNVLEAAEAIGATRKQTLFRVKLPLALPAIMLGLNQTIIYAIGMLVIAALVGTNGLGQLVYIGLGNGDFGVGMTAGIGMAVVAMIADRMTQAVSKKRQDKYGLTANVI